MGFENVNSLTARRGIAPGPTTTPFARGIGHRAEDLAPTWADGMAADLRLNNEIGSPLGYNADVQQFVAGLEGVVSGVDTPFVFVDDPDFDPHDALLNSGTIMEANPDEREKSGSLPEWLARRDNLEREVRDRETLSRIGFGRRLAIGLLTQGLLSPINFIPFGAAFRMSVGSTSILRHMGHAALLGATTNAVVEIPLQATQQFRGAAESAMAIGAGAALGSILGGAVGAWRSFISPGKQARAARELGRMFDQADAEMPKLGGASRHTPHRTVKATDIEMMETGQRRDLDGLDDDWVLTNDRPASTGEGPNPVDVAIVRDAELEPLGVARQPVRDETLGFLNDTELGERTARAEKGLDQLEARFDEAPELVETDLGFRLELAHAQDILGALELEKFQRIINKSAPDDLGSQLRNLDLRGEESRIKARMIVETVQKRGLQEDLKADLLAFAERSPDHAEIINRKLTQLRDADLDPTPQNATPELRGARKRIAHDSLKRGRRC